MSYNKNNRKVYES